MSLIVSVLLLWIVFRYYSDNYNLLGEFEKEVIVQPKLNTVAPVKTPRKSKSHA
jgi:hypothetical protein